MLGRVLGAVLLILGCSVAEQQHGPHGPYIVTFKDGTSEKMQQKLIDGVEKLARAYVTSVGQQEYDTLMLSFGDHPAKLAFELTANVPV